MSRYYGGGGDYTIIKPAPRAEQQSGVSNDPKEHIKQKLEKKRLRNEDPGMVTRYKSG